MWIWVVIPHHLETASYYPAISVTPSASPSLNSPPSSSSGDDTKPRSNYFPGFCHAPASTWDPLVAHNICIVNGKFKVPSTLQNTSQ
ncbi:hypothetical protein DSO57_1006196 [Entomophthora muscae]|uniref:Uncharacterized protein n=1 Tax=Entomophthora muscae TaxID=34485 RepID=A0ACC2RMI2_9FUNG|nr:hypothetical protein DSO57_1006196 [Entomophthora muscae]